MTDQLNPDDFVITRRRKKYKFAKFANANNCFEYDEWIRCRTDDNNSKSGFSGPVKKANVEVLEIGAGTGLFSVELAARYPEKHFVAVDVKADRLQKGAYVAIERRLSNVSFVRARADQIEELSGAGAVSAIWLTFPDPYPKKGGAGRRLTHPTFLARYARLLAPDGSLYLKHDNIDFFTWSLEQLVEEQWYIAELSFDLHESDLGDDYKITTTYEQRWQNEGRITNFVHARKVRIR